MESNAIAYLVIGLIIGGTGGYIVLNSQYSPIGESLTTLTQEHEALTQQYVTLQDEYETLSDQYDSLNSIYNSLDEQYSSLSSSYDTLGNIHSTLQANYDNLVSDFNYLQNDHDVILYDYDNILSYWISLSKDVMELRETLISNFKIPEAFSSVLNEDELNKIGSMVSSVTHNSQDTWLSYDRIYRHIKNNIEYAHDTEFPYIGQYHYFTYGGNNVVDSFDVGFVRNFIQTPSFTLEYKQGDCDDQAVLVYSMIKYYQREIYGTEYTLFLADIEFNEGEGHVAVFMPVQGGQLCIIDTAGNYLTSQSGRITQKVAASEITNYSNRWSEQGGISQITLYKIYVDGSYTIDITGTKNDIVDFLST
jgi:hypothetical protein